MKHQRPSYQVTAFYDFPYLHLLDRFSGFIQLGGSDLDGRCLGGLEGLMLSIGTGNGLVGGGKLGGGSLSGSLGK
jgi:hypothetical protein